MKGEVTHVGFFNEHPFYYKIETKNKKKFVKFLANGVAKMSKLDSGGFFKDGSKGK